MAKPDYRVLTFDLTNARDRERIVDPGVEHNGVGIRDVPAGVDIAVALGDNSDLIPLAPGEWFAYTARRQDGCPGSADEGMFLSHAAAAGTLVLAVSMGDLVVTSG